MEKPGGRSALVSLWGWGSPVAALAFVLSQELCGNDAVKGNESCREKPLTMSGRWSQEDGSVAPLIHFWRMDLFLCPCLFDLLKPLQPFLSGGSQAEV